MHFQAASMEGVRRCSLESIEEYPSPGSPREPMEFLARSWTIPALEVSTPFHKLTSSLSSTGVTNPLTSQLVMERILSQSEGSPLTSGRLSQSSGPLNVSASGSPPASPMGTNDLKRFLLLQEALNPDPCNRGKKFHRSFSAAKPCPLRGKTVGRWLKEKKEKKKEETRVYNAQVHAATAVAGVAAAVAAIAAACATGGSDGQSKTNMAVASAATLVAAQCAEVAESMGAHHQYMASVVNSAVNVKTPGDIMTLTAGAATALRGAATLKVRALKEVRNNASVIPYDKGGSATTGPDQELGEKGDELAMSCQEVLARGGELLKRTRKGVLHWKLVFVYIKHGQVMVKLKSKHMGGTFTKKKKSMVFDVYKYVPAWPGRDLLEGGECKRYFGLNTDRGVIQFECKDEKEHQAWTEGISRILSLTQQHKLI
ncbi:VAN3-binding protein isoform X1 [Cryptomeria japonica]|uniref:VAN3-binding protein isoform X1 n=1 Tax=Cryptomeria japonica TaxID=3369 RepID=UPI0025ACA767|nr:VAN3-binding protein isoform X1 [Cryptomeria japonica]